MLPICQVVTNMEMLYPIRCKSWVSTPSRYFFKLCSLIYTTRLPIRCKNWVFTPSSRYFSKKKSALFFPDHSLVFTHELRKVALPHDGIGRSTLETKPVVRHCVQVALEIRHDAEAYKRRNRLEIDTRGLSSHEKSHHPDLLRSSTCIHCRVVNDVLWSPQQRQARRSVRWKAVLREHGRSVLAMDSTVYESRRQLDRKVHRIFFVNDGSLEEKNEEKKLKKKKKQEKCGKWGSHLWCVRVQRWYSCGSKQRKQLCVLTHGP